MKSPSTVKEIQSLTGRAAALNRFLSKSTDKCRPFFKALKKGQKDKWDKECEVAFQNLKTYLTSPPLLSKPVPGEDLFVYLSVSNSAVSSALIREEHGAQHPIFYTSKALLDAETRYPKLEKLILALVLITSQASGEYMAKHPRMILYLDKVQELLKAFPTFTIQQVPRAENAHADALASLGSALDTQFRRSIPVEHLDQPSIEEAKQPDLMQIDEDPSWQDPIIDYLVNENLPEDKSEARKIKQKAARYYMRGDMLIRRSYSGPHLTCIKYPQTLEVLCKIHDGECGNHVGGRSLAQKALSIGYFWPSMRQDSTEYARRCDRCQRYKLVPGLPAEEYHPQNSPWPFMQWAIDLVGPMPTAPANKEMMIVATDYFTKWIEAKALSSTKEADVERFIWKNIICIFGCPQSIVTDNGTQFVGRQIIAFFAKYGIKQHLSTPRYPQGNGQAEASNKIVLDCLKKRLEGAEGKWVDELPGILWAYRTTKRRSTEETPFSLAYGT
ncbi:unnamed protein product, partial [Prunus brigantina]